MAKKVKWNFAVVRSMFGDLWIGKTKLEPVKDKIFIELNDAIEKAKNLFMDSHMDFDPSLEEDDDGYEYELAEQYEEFDITSEETAEEIKKDIAKFIV